jgi:hypothetical protein
MSVNLTLEARLSTFVLLHRPYISPRPFSGPILHLVCQIPIMYVKSPYLDVPQMPERNVHHLFFHRPGQAEWKDYTLYIDVETGKRQTFRQFLDRVQLGMTALGASVGQGGLGLGTWKDGEMIGIIDQNSMVHCSKSYLSWI